MKQKEVEMAALKEQLAKAEEKEKERLLNSLPENLREEYKTISVAELERLVKLYNIFKGSEAGSLVKAKMSGDTDKVADNIGFYDRTQGKWIYE